MKGKYKILALTFFLSQSAWAANWTFASFGREGAIWYIDTDTIKETVDYPYGNVKKFWVKVDHSKDKTTRINQSKILFYVRCNDEQVKYVSWIDYDPQGGVMSSDYGASSYKPITPESVIAGATDIACK